MSALAHLDHQCSSTYSPTAFGVKLATAETGIVQNLRMAGQQYDIATGLHYNHNRFYNPKLGRYMEPDPIKLEGGNNPYAYVGNDPVNMVDPSGLNPSAMSDSQMSNSGVWPPAIPDYAYQFTMGLSNGASFGLGQPISNAIYGRETANVSSGYYTAGEITSFVVGAASAVKGAISSIRIEPLSLLMPEFTASINMGSRSISELSQAAAAADRGGLTAAGRALQKHGSRENSAFPAATGSPSSINRQGQNIVDNILMHPSANTTTRNHARYGQLTEVRTPDGRGIRYDSNGKFMGLLEP